MKEECCREAIERGAQALRRDGRVDQAVAGMLRVRGVLHRLVVDKVLLGRTGLLNPPKNRNDGVSGPKKMVLIVNQKTGRHHPQAVKGRRPVQIQMVKPL